MRSSTISGTRLRRIAARVALGLVGLIVVGRITGMLVDWLWFSSIGYVDVFWTILFAKALLFVTVFAVSAVAIGLSGWLAHRHASRPGSWKAEVLSELIGEVAPHIPWGAA